MAPLPRPPAAVTFDCWSTLLRDLDTGAALHLRGAALVEAAARLGATVDIEAACALMDRAWLLHVDVWRSGGLFGPDGAAAWCLDELSLAPGSKDIKRLATAISRATIRAGTAVVDGAAEALALLKARAIPTALICDTGFTPSWCVREALEGHGVALDHYFFSDEVGVPKPDPAIFRAALDATGAEPATAIHIGDLRRTDVGGARASGMASIRFTGVHDDGWLREDSVGHNEADAVLHSWSDLGELLGL